MRLKQGANMKQISLIYRLAVVLVVVALVLAGCGRKPGTMEGTVTDAQSSEPIAGATVAVFALERFQDVSNMDVYKKGVILHKLSTDESGQYTLSLDADKYVIQIWVDGIEVADRMVEIKPGRSTTADFNVEVPSP